MHAREYTILYKENKVYIFDSFMLSIPSLIKMKEKIQMALSCENDSDKNDILCSLRDDIQKCITSKEYIEPSNEPKRLYGRQKPIGKMRNRYMIDMC
jgi:hypothetical protein